MPAPPQVLSEQQKEEIKQQFRARRRRQLWATLPLLALVALSFWTRAQPDAAIGGVPLAKLVPVAIVALAAFVVFTLVNWRCPACGSYLGKGIGPSFCRKCGVALD